jgi:hypothetical protein
VGRGRGRIARSSAGPGGKAILPAGYEGYSGGSWSELARDSSRIAGYMTVLYRMYGIYNVLFGFMGTAIALTAFRRGERWAWWALLVGNTVALVSAIRYDWMVNAIGPFELTEYVGLVLIWAALAITVPFAGAGRLIRSNMRTSPSENVLGTADATVPSDNRSPSALRHTRCRPS